MNHSLQTTVFNQIVQLRPESHSSHIPLTWLRPQYLLSLLILSVCRSFFLSVCLSFFPSVCLSFYLTFCLSLCSALISLSALSLCSPLLSMFLVANTMEALNSDFCPFLPKLAPRLVPLLRGANGAGIGGGQQQKEV